MGEIQTISYVGVSDVQAYPDMDNDQYNIRRFKNYCFNLDFLCHFEDGNIIPDGLLSIHGESYLNENYITTTSITPNTVYTFISYHNNNPSNELCIYCNNGSYLVAKFPTGNSGISLVTGTTPGTITDQTKFTIYNSGSIDFGWIIALPYVKDNWPLPALWCKTGPNILNTGMGVNKGHILVSNTYTEGFAYNNNQNKGEPCFYYLDDTMLPTNLQGNEPMILYNGRRSATLPDATSNEDAILKIQQNQNLLIYDADMSDYVYYNMENTTLLFDFGNLNTYDGSNSPPRIYNLKNTLWDYYLNVAPNTGSTRYAINNGSPNNKGFYFREGVEFTNTSSQLIMPADGYFVIGMRVKVYPDSGNSVAVLIHLPQSIRLIYEYDTSTTTHNFSLQSYSGGSYITLCLVNIQSSQPVRATVVCARVTAGFWYLNVVGFGSSSTVGYQPLAATNGQFNFGIGSTFTVGGIELNLIQMWLNYNIGYNSFINATEFSNNFHSIVSARWPA